jgi:hypothetical protein
VFWQYADDNASSQIEGDYSSSNPLGGNTTTVNSYQKMQGSGGGYQSPVSYALDQPKSLEHTTRTYYQAEHTAGQVLNQMTAQRRQIMGAHNDVWDMRQTTEKVKQELEELKLKY